MKKILKIALVFIALFTFANTTKVSALTNIQPTEAKSRFDALHAKYDNAFKNDGDWFKAGNNNHELTQINFAKWLLKNGHGSELVKESEFRTTATGYNVMIASWRELINTGNFTSSASANPKFNAFSGNNKSLKDLQPFYYDNNLFTYVNSEKNNARVDKGDHTGSKYAENLYPSMSGFTNNIEWCILGYLSDEDNGIQSMEGGHRWNLLSSNKFAATAMNSNTANIFVATNSGTAVMDSSSNTSSSSTSNVTSWKWFHNSKGWWYGNGKDYKKGWFKVKGTWYWSNKSGYLWTYKGWSKCKSGWVYNNGTNGSYTSKTVKLYTSKTKSYKSYTFNANAIWVK